MRMIRNFEYLIVFTSVPGVLPEQNDRYRIQPWKVNEIKAYKKFMSMRVVFLKLKALQVCKIWKNVCFWLLLHGKILFEIVFLVVEIENRKCNKNLHWNICSAFILMDGCNISSQFRLGFVFEESYFKIQ